MKRKLVVLFSVIVTLSLPAWFEGEAGQASNQEIRGNQEQPFYGSQLMTQDERLEYHRQMRETKTAEERELLRKEHHQRMQDRAAIRGVTLPEEPPARGSGMGMGQGGGGMMNGGSGNR